MRDPVIRASHTAPALFLISFNHSQGFECIVIEPMLFNEAAYENRDRGCPLGLGLPPNRELVNDPDCPYTHEVVEVFRCFGTIVQLVPLTNLRRGMVRIQSLDFAVRSACLSLGDSQYARCASSASQRPQRHPV